MKRNLLIFGFALALAGLAVFQNERIERKSSVSAAGRPEIKLESPVPAFTLKGLDGGEYKVGGAREKPLMLNFWASWCGPCREEAPALKQVYDRYKEQFDLYAVNVTRGDELDAVRRFVNQAQFSFPVLLDTSGETADAYRLLFVPTSFLIDRQGRLKEVVHVLPPDQLEDRIKRLIAS
ncbi:TlpA family protein disulfide reductase [Paenibacillus sp. MZ04-78.2]|uniref:TlpA family protein disulfide reductase n=1 Tax=Paenibacillus sp. MZ04-78.2 TaxID=2962034 RepID=UPI0020B844AB|nr:TlpA family protein disulfide reductase [Paenibacillus sp. MZ04-78.2]MCP3772051.1 TlpA family protein disulfide reductase [Paenibacillus sp. MZ04-78.2]